MQVFAIRKAPVLGRALNQLTCLIKCRMAVRIMKLTAILLLGACLQLSAKGISQTITLSVTDAPLEKVFQVIEKQTDYVFFVKTELLKTAKSVTIKVSNLPLQQVLDLCFKNQPLKYSINGKIITIAPKKVLADIENASTGNLANQSIDVKGRVVNENNDPVEGVNVIAKGTTNGTSTNANGEFSLKGVDENGTLVFTSVNMETFELKVKGRTFLEVALQTKITSMLEIVVNKGYYTEKRKLATGNVSTVTSKDIQKQPVNNPLLALQGRVPGMVITQGNGLPGSGVKVQIRGQNSISNGNLPLYIIDGVPYISENLRNLGNFILGQSGTNGNAGGSPLSFLNPSDIEAIDVLKDADATAIYGSRAANGVVLITTKKGRNGKMGVDVNVQSGWGKVPHMVDLLNTRQYLDMRYEALRNDGLTTIPASARDLTVWDTTMYTDWQKLFIGGTARYDYAQASLNGGNNNTLYLVSAGYRKETTVFPNDFRNQQGSLHFNLNSSSPNKKIRFVLSNSFTVNNNQIPLNDLTGLAITLSPDAPSIYNPDGSLNWAKSTWTNPFASYLYKKYKSETYNLVSNATVSYQVTPWLEIKSNFGYTRLQTEDRTIDPAIAKNPASWASFGTDLRKSSFLNNNFNSWIIEPQLIYTKNIGKGIFSALVGATIQQTKSYMQQVDAKGFSNDVLIEDLKSGSVISIAGTNFANYKYNALFGRINYNWQEKYIANITARRDGTSRFGPANRFHNFGAAGVAWIFSKESFFEKYIGLLSFGKVRASYGTTGSDQVGDYTFLDLYNSINVGVPYQGTIGTQLARHYTPDLAWEETKKMEVGLNMGFWKDRIVIDISHYQNTSSNQLVSYSLPYSTGLPSITKNLDAKIQNRGWELSLSTVNINSKKFRWTSNFNIFWNRNKLTAVAPGMSSNYNSLLGRSLNSIFLYKFGGVNDTTGQYQFVDSKGDLTYTPDPVTDMTVIMDLNPKISGGFQNSIQFQDFQLDFFFHYVKQNGRSYLYNNVPGSWGATSGAGNQPVGVVNRWQKEGDVSNIQKFNSNFSLLSSYNNAILSDQVYSDISFIRLKNVSISWQIPKAWQKNIHLQNGRIYVQGQNLLTFTDYKGFDPENASTSSLPPLRVITIGFQIMF